MAANRSLKFTSLASPATASRTWISGNLSGILVTPRPSPSSVRHRGVWFSLGVGFVTFLVFSPALRHAFLDAWDDNVAITQNPDYNPARLSTLLHYWVPPPHDKFFVPVQYTLWGLVAMAAR